MVDVFPAPHAKAAFKGFVCASCAAMASAIVLVAVAVAVVFVVVGAADVQLTGVRNAAVAVFAIAPTMPCFVKAAVGTLCCRCSVCFCSNRACMLPE